MNLLNLHLGEACFRDQGKNASTQLLSYSVETTHLFEMSQSKTIAFSGNTVHKEEVNKGWAIYNFDFVYGAEKAA